MRDETKTKHWRTASWEQRVCGFDYYPGRPLSVSIETTKHSGQSQAMDEDQSAEEVFKTNNLTITSIML